MRKVEKVKHPFEPIICVNPELDKYKNTIWLPEKLALAEKMLENARLPERVKNSKPGK